MFKFLHAADIHLDSPLSGLERYEGAPVEEIRGATRRALDNLVHLAIAERVQFVLLAGDQYDGDHDDYRTILFFTRQLNRLREAGIRVFAITGNHDAASLMTRSLRLPDNVTLLSSQRAETVELDDLGIAIHGRGFARQAEYDNFVPDYPGPRPGRFNIGLLHTALDGREGHVPYAPCSLDQLRLKGYDYWALGHIHQREIVAEEPCIVFAGNLQGRHIRETGPKGCFLVEVDERGQPTPQFVPLDVFRWALCDVPAGGADHADQVVERAAERLAALAAESERPLGVRVRVQGATAADAALRSNSDKWMQEIRAAAQRVDAGRLWVEKVVFTTTTTAQAAVDLDGPLGELRAYLDELRGDDALLADLGRELDDLRGKLPAAALGGEPILANDPAGLRQLLDDALPLLEGRLQGREGAA